MINFIHQFRIKTAPIAILFFIASCAPDINMQIQMAPKDDSHAILMEQAEKIIVTKRSMVQNCDCLGTVELSPKQPSEIEKCMEKAKVRAAALGATHIVWIHMSTGEVRGLAEMGGITFISKRKTCKYIKGMAYRCG
jgi:hypothetical protein